MKPKNAIAPIALAIVLVVVLGGGVYAYATIAPLFAISGQVVPHKTVIVVVNATAVPVTATPQQAIAVAGATPVPIQATATSSSPQVNQVQAADAPTAVPTITLPSLANNQRVNFLLLGSDTDLKFAPDAYLTQSIIVVSVDPVAKTVSMLSIPRDLWVYIPGYGAGKIQIAYEVGGIDLIRTTVEQDFGIPIHYYAWVGLQGFQKLIDTVGGVTMDVSHPVLDDAYPDDLNASDPYAYMRLLQPAGPQHLTGVEALQFVRSRHGDLVGDFGRSSRQQALLLALKQRLLQPDMLLHLPQLTGDLEGNVRTDVPASDFLQYAGFARTLKATDIRQVVLQPPVYSDNSVTADGKQDIVIPHWQAIDQIVTQLFKTQPRPSIADRNAANVAQAAPVATATPRESQHSAVAGTTPVATVRPVATDTPLPPSSDQLAVLVENDTTVSGLAQKATTYLQTQGYRVLAPVTGKPGLTHTAVNFYIPEARAQALNIARLLGASVNDQSRTGSSSTTIIVVLGKDAVSKFS